MDDLDGKLGRPVVNAPARPGGTLRFVAFFAIVVVIGVLLAVFLP